jgi:hypothetical protein
VAFDGTSARVVWTNYLDIKSRTVPLRSAPASATQVLRSGLPFEPGVALGCSNGTCLVSWEESVPQGAFGGNALLSRLGSTSALADVPPFEVSFPADEQGAPTIVSDGVAHTVVFTRALGRQPRELAVRRLADDGHWLDPAPVVLGQRYQPLAAAPLVDGGVLVAATFSPTLGIDDALYGFRVDTATGAATDAGIWFSASFQPWHVALACTATRCGLLADSGNGVLSSVVSPAGVKLSSSNIYLSFLSSATAENLVAVGSRFVALYSTATDQLAAVADEAAFPTFGTPAPLAPGVTNGCVPVGIGTTGTDLAAFFTERSTCKTMARVVDTLTGQPKGSVLTVRQCAAGAGGSAVRGVARHGAGFSVLVQDLVTLPSGAYQTDTVLLELDATLQLVSQQVLDSRAGGDTLPVSFTRVGTHPVVALASFDATAGILSTRAWLSGLDALDGGVVDAGRPDAGRPDAGLADAGAPDASVTSDAGQPEVDAGPIDAGQLADAGQPDAGTSAPGTSSGCGCSSVDGALLLAATLLLGRRRRQV